MECEKPENVEEAKEMLDEVAAECLFQIENLPRHDVISVFNNDQSNELSSENQNLNRNMFIRGYCSCIDQASSFETLGRISENCTVADVQFHERLASNSKDLEKCYESTCARNNRYKLFLNKLKVTEEELLAVKTEIESDDKEDDDTTLSMLNRMFQQLKKDMNFVLDKLVPENKDSVKELLSNLQKNRNEWHKINDDIEVSVVMMLLNANVIVQHPELKNYFKLAPLCDD